MVESLEKTVCVAKALLVGIKQGRERGSVEKKPVYVPLTAIAYTVINRLRRIHPDMHCDQAVFNDATKWVLGEQIAAVNGRYPGDTEGRALLSAWTVTSGISPEEVMREFVEARVCVADQLGIQLENPA
jgi:hypothetical protein